ncbi:UDP-N-acetylmuramate dehydrogenase [Falsarthrobacter nasiphocae]|uniref:UDP-N-acetylenolpyruvoylglucosamine reductase n=1 Tax=Falsarthrobacter nasiphocae TaxID=189863 RepID=A0AAE3YFI4_9MICC|nr:UDP-N-acetylmuramate dehydrogenase [Falsarthrobacter nasiphocae]MDR6892484.1 UDP-N-acetylmuramate dehydrogenase [Falsarthrobacter nasiphocae]
MSGAEAAGVPVEQTLAGLTTLGVGGPVKRLLTAESEQAIIESVTAADDAGDPVLVIGGGSNLVISDEGFDGTVVHIASTGVSFDDDGCDGATCGGTLATVQAGHEWDDFVVATLEHGLKGLEPLSGIPGSAGATPVQNVGAYGAEVASFISSVRTWDRQSRQLRTFSAGELEFSYRDSLLKRETVNGSPRYVVLTVTFQLLPGTKPAPAKYAELARVLEDEFGPEATTANVREAVLRLRASKGMVLNPEDRDTWSTGSFFTNPIVPVATAKALPEDAPRYPAGEGLVKLSAAWLIDHAGFGKGYGLEVGREVADGRASLSTKHTLAITNRGDARSDDILAIARAVRDGVEARFGVRLENEPVFVNAAL